MKKHVDMEHGALLKRYVEEVNNHPKPSLEHESATKCPHVNQLQFIDFFLLQTNFKKTTNPKLFFWKM